MLLLSRRWRVTGGLVVGGAAVALLSWATVGWDGCRAWVRSLAFSGQVVAGSGDSWHLSKYVDMSAFLHLLLGSSPVVTASVLILLGIAAMGVLGRAWSRVNLPHNELWAATLCFTLVVSPYAPIYDAVLVVAAVALVAAKREQRETFGVWVLLLYMVPWLTQAFAEFLHLQLFTLVLAGFGIWALRLGL